MANCECGILRLKLEHAEERLANLQRINNALAAAVSNPRIIKFGLDWK